MTHSDNVHDFLRILFADGDVFEIRAPKCPVTPGRDYRRTASGYFNEFHKASAAVESLDGDHKPPGIYVTLNPVRHDLLARAANRMEHQASSTTEDADILCRRWLLLDVDPVRPADVSATDGERDAALELATTIRKELGDEGWPVPLLGCSGNGSYLIYRLPDLPNNDESTQLIQEVIRGIAARYDMDAAKIDTTPYNTSRILKVLGTHARKGDDLRGQAGVDDRPHRRSWFEVPTSELRPVPRQRLDAIRKKTVTTATAHLPSTNGHADDAVLVRARKYLAKMDPAIQGQHGSDRTLHAACVLVRDFALDADNAWSILLRDYNPRCAPPWSELDLRRKLNEAVKKTAGEAKGSKINAPPTRSKSAWADSHRRIIEVRPKEQHVSDVMEKITSVFVDAGDTYVRTGNVVVIHDEAFRTIVKAEELAGALNVHAEVKVVQKRNRQYVPLPTIYGRTWLNHPEEMARLPAISLFTRNPVYDQDWNRAQPGYNASSGIYYAGTSIKPAGGTDCLDNLLREFCWKEAADRTNYLGLLLTALTVPMFIGSKPGGLFSGNQPSLGKTVLGQIVSILRDGRATETATYNPNDEEFEKRLGTLIRDGGSVVIIDNAKARGRNVTIDSAVLERSITDTCLSYRLLGHSAAIRAENSHLFLITANTPQVSRDLVTRCVVINLFFEGNPEHRRFQMDDPEQYAIDHRRDLLAELLGMIERWKRQGRPMAQTHSRFNKRGWGNIIGGILDANNEPDFLGNAEEAAREMDPTRMAFAELVGLLAADPQGVWSAGEMARLAGEHNLLAGELGDGSDRSRSTRLGVIASRFINETFQMDGGGRAVFRQQPSTHARSKRYSVYLEGGEC